MKISIRIVLFTIVLIAVCSQGVAVTPPRNVGAAISNHFSDMASQRGEQERYFESGLDRCDGTTQKMAKDYLKVVKTVIGREDFQNIFITSVLECAKERTKAPEKMANLDAFAVNVCTYWAKVTDNAKSNDAKMRFQEQWDIANKAKKKIAAGKSGVPARKPTSNPAPQPTPPALIPTAPAQTPKVESRVWASGKFTVEAVFVNVTSDSKSVVLRRSDNNKEITVPIEKLSVADQQYVNQKISDSK